MKIPQIIKYLNSCHESDSGSYRFTENAPSTLLATDFAIMTLCLTKQINSIDKEQIRNSILKHKTLKNSFIDSLFDPNIERNHKPDYVINQFTFFSLIALDQLGLRFNKLPFFDKYLDPDNLQQWFNSLNWGKFWYESNKVMFWLYFLSYLQKYADEPLKEQAGNCLNLAFDVLDKKQDKNTGYWGTDLNNNNIVDGCFGSAHIYLFYDYFGKDIKHKEKIIDNTLSLHTKNGLILSPEGGACEDYDAVEIYMRLLKQTDYRK